MQALQQRYAVTAGQPYVVPQGTQPVYIMAIQTDTGCSVPLVMDGVVSRNKFCNSLFLMCFTVVMVMQSVIWNFTSLIPIF